jgi:hypothetical protein
MSSISHSWPALFIRGLGCGVKSIMGCAATRPAYAIELTLDPRRLA